MTNRRKKNGIWLIIAVIIISMMLIVVITAIRALFPLNYKSSIEQYASEYNIDPPLVAAVIRTESNFNPSAESQMGARGLMQITPQTGKWIAEKLEIVNYRDDMLYDPDINVRLGCWYINYLNDYYGNDFQLIFAAYNGGIGNVDKWLKDKKLSQSGRSLDVIPYPETENFIGRVDRFYKIYKKLYKWGK